MKCLLSLSFSSQPISEEPGVGHGHDTFLHYGLVSSIWVIPTEFISVNLLIQGKQGKPLMAERSNCFAISARKTKTCYIQFQSQLQIQCVLLNTDMIRTEVSAIPRRFLSFKRQMLNLYIVEQVNSLELVSRMGCTSVITQHLPNRNRYQNYLQYIFVFCLAQQKQNGFISMPLINFRVFWLITRFKC